MTKIQKDAIADVLYALIAHKKVLVNLIPELPLSEDLEEVCDGMEISIDKIEKAFPKIRVS